jgi:hypothetical protein
VRGAWKHWGKEGRVERGCTYWDAIMTCLTTNRRSMALSKTRTVQAGVRFGAVMCGVIAFAASASAFLAPASTWGRAQTCEPAALVTMRGYLQLGKSLKLPDGRPGKNSEVAAKWRRSGAPTGSLACKAVDNIEMYRGPFTKPEFLPVSMTRGFQKWILAEGDGEDELRPMFNSASYGEASLFSIQSNAANFAVFEKLFTAKHVP